MQEHAKRWAVLGSVVALLMFLGLDRGPRGSGPALSPSLVDEDANRDECTGSFLPAAYAAAPSAAVPAAGDIGPIRLVQDPYPSLHSIALDPLSNQVVMSDSNRGNLLFYARTGGGPSPSVVVPDHQIRGPATGMMFIAGVALDPAHQEVFTVDNDIGDRMLVFPYGVEGNVKPKRVLFVPHGSWGTSLDAGRGEIALSVEHINAVVVYRREASGGEAPLRVIRGANTQLADPHGIAVAEEDHEILVANHGNWAPLTRREAIEGKWRGGQFQLPSVTTFDEAAAGDITPLRTLQGERTQLNWPMGLGLDPEHNEFAVANYGSNSVLIFRRTDQGDVAPMRMIAGDRTGILGPVGVAIDWQNDELWVTNYRDHSAVVFARTAEGNVAPKRILRNAPLGTPAVGFGNPGAVAYDSKRKEILVPN
jgi:DNA-binding beta-propeller fold protein YncE